MSASKLVRLAAGGAVLAAVGVVMWAVAASAHGGGALPELRLDEEIVVRTRGVARARHVTVRRQDDRTPVPGQRFVGRLLEDRTLDRRIVVNPEAVRDHFMLVRGLARDDAEPRAKRLLRSVERTGRTRKLERLDADLRNYFGEFHGGGARLDDPTVFARIPPTLHPGATYALYRLLVAGDDDLWERFVVDRDAAALAELRSDPRFERFHVPSTPPGTAGGSLIRRREYRRVLIDRRSRRHVTFVPDIPVTPDASDTAYEPGADYAVRVRGGALRIRSGLDLRIPVRRRLFTAIGDLGEDAFAAAEERTLEANQTTPRVLNVTPPSGEVLVLPETDWEWPDSLQEDLGPHRPFVVRLRFSHPLDPRTVSPTTFRLERLSAGHGPGRVVFAIPEPAPATVDLTQARLGKVEVTLTPTEILLDDSEYRVFVSDRVRSLGGAPMTGGFESSFTTGAGDVALDEIKESFITPVNRLGAGLHPFVIGLPDPTTALWPAPPSLDPDFEGRVMPDPALADSVAYSRFFDTRRSTSVIQLRPYHPPGPFAGPAIFAPDNGSTVEVAVRTTPEWTLGGPDLFRASDWTPIDSMDELPPGRFFQFRIDFHLPADLPPDAELPYVSLLSFELR